MTGMLLIQEPTARPAEKRKRRKRHNILGDVHEYEEALRRAERPPTPPPRQDSFNVADLPRSVLEAMQLCPQAYGPMLQAYKSLYRERESLLQQYERIQEQRRAAQPDSALPETLTGQLAATRDSRILAQHKEREELWARKAVALGAQLSKKPEDVTLTRIFKHRKRQEKLNHIHKSKPVQDRVTGPTFWQISLRNAYSRFVPIGNEFSGLFTEVIERPPEEMNVPLEIFGKPAACDPSRSSLAKSLSLKAGLTKRKLLRTQEEKGRAWLQGSYLKKVEAQYCKDMKTLMPHTPETDELAVMATSMTERLLQSARSSISLEETLRRLKVSDADAYSTYSEARAAKDQEDRLEAERQLEEAQRAAEAARAQAGLQGPALELNSSRLTFECPVSQTDSAKVKLKATGTAAVYYSWAHAAPKLRFTTSVQHDEPSAFYMSQQQGVILPGEEKDFVFLFKPNRVGMFTETWTLSTQPALVPQCDLKPLVLRGAAITSDRHALARRLFTEQLNASQRQRQVASALERILRDVDCAPPVHPHLPEGEQREHDRFAAGTVDVVPAVYYAKGRGAPMQAIFDSLREVLVPPPDPKKKPKKGEQEQAPAMPEAFDGRMDSLRSYIQKLRDLDSERPGSADEAASYDSQLDAICGASALPEQQAVVNAHAIRRLIVRLADTVDDLAELATRTAVENAEQRRQEALERGEPVEEAEPPPPEPAPKGKKGKGAANDPPPPVKPNYDVAEMHELLEASVREQLRQTFNQTEATIQAELKEVGGVLDQRIAKTQAKLVAAVKAGASNEEQAALAWDTFALLRKRVFHNVPSSPAPLAVKPRPLRSLVHEDV